MERARHLLRSSLIVIAFLAATKLTGLLRTRLVAAAFGTGSEIDAFTAANQLPELFVTLISAGALAAAFIPVYSASLSRDGRQSARLANSVITLVLLALGAISAVGILLAPWIAGQLVPGFPAEQQRLTAGLMRIILIQTTLFGVSGVLSSILNAHQHFALPALAPIGLDLGYLIGLNFFVPALGIQGLAWGTVAGALLHIAIQLPALWRYRFQLRPALDLRLAGVREVLRLMGPRIVTLGSVQLADLFIIRLASGMGTGSTSGYFLAYYIMQLPETLFGTAIATVVFPTMAERYNAGDLDGLKRTAMGALRIIWMLTIPSAVLLLVLGRQAIGVVFQSGAFTGASTEIVYAILVAFALRIVSEASLEIVARLFYAQHDTRTPMWVALGWLALNVGLAFPLAEALGAPGLAWASTIAFSLQSAALFLLNRRRLGDLDAGRLLRVGARGLLGGLALALVALAVQSALGDGLISLLAAASAGVAAYLLVSYLAGARELADLLGLFRARLA
ncbi:MAG: murein biosynthesis integral membrane protein MurJ [Candidatus Promineifilaceae bacterium]